MQNILLILLLQLVYVPILTLRTIFLVKNMTLIAAAFGFIESLIYVFGLSLVFNGEQETVALIVYALGFGIGMMIGGAIENKLAIGYNNLMVNLMEKNMELINYLRNEGFGVTVYEGEGRDSKRYRLDILTKRSREEELIQIIEEYEPKAFIISYEARRFKGGFLVNSMKKMKSKNE
ncbi:DUF5698 domain-containing protein [Irregularibacter muris]|uniref:UPF0316 protein NSA47_12705 n=1 Tax=Irregularibacter muris TaxID=1796619 RepID=A0AAE3HIL2_9FIRM|nr:DUF5698 domain-containing protein [Irregularibacter muris]MCR1899833.1 DUF5698 domain-containing protein [Irregularibacter muris]